ncbi:hypothetical protein NQ317_008492 [Molorchus minor]|uniref:Glutaredoxin domain-containing protein n=1 Tax=Molorchus minor TaxID=1323400 RepID=A0ABQ9JN97_9CUCU|nr:hypothetical protein NQ317_008492 [Molorchus minor]
MAIFEDLYWRVVDSISFLLQLMGIFSSKRMAVDLSSPKATLVKDLIKSDKIVIFSKSYCPYCKLAKEVFNKLQEKYTAIELDSRDDGEDIQSILGEITGARTVPRVFIKENCVGGGLMLKRYMKKGNCRSL